LFLISKTLYFATFAKHAMFGVDFSNYIRIIRYLGNNGLQVTDKKNQFLRKFEMWER